MPLLEDQLTLSTPEAIVLDGANGVLAEPRQHFPHAAWFSALAVAAVVGVLLWQRLGARRPALALALLVAALPGAVGVLALRADAPARRDALADEVSDAVEAIEARAPWPGAVSVVRESDDVRFPLGRYALPTRRKPARPGVELELEGSRVSTSCRASPASRHLVCGDAK